MEKRNICLKVICSLILMAINYLSLITAGAVQEDIDYLASNMEVRYDVLNNTKSETTFLSRITLSNKGQSVIRQGDWAVYFCNIRMAESRYLKHNPAGYVIPGNYGIRFTHINGCLHKFETTTDFRDIAAGSSFTFEFVADYWSVARTDVMPRWYVTAEGLSPRVIKNTDDEELKFVGNFDTEEKWKRFVADRYNPYTPKERYDKYYIAHDHESVQYKIIPTPVEMTLETDNHVIVESDWKVFGQAGLESEAALLKEKLKLSSTTSTGGNKVITLVLGEVAVPTKVGQQFPSMHESYSLDVDPSKDAITIMGRSSAGVFYGLQTLLGLQSSEGRFPKVSIKDSPRYAYRGMHLDVARNFVAKEHVLKLLDVMAMYKLNAFHFHLTDDEGWRLEIPGLPELTEVGHDISGPRASLPQNVQPLTTFHFGGDEVAQGAWINSAACVDLVQRLNLSNSDGSIADKLKDYFVQRVSDITLNYNLQLAGWEDGLMDVNNVPYNRSVLKNSKVYGYAWNNIWEWGGGKRAYELANAGYQVIMSQATHLYFDHPYEPDPEERGYYWATRFTDTRKVFGFMPDDLFANVEIKRTGDPLTREQLCKTEGSCPVLAKKENIAGMQGHLWTETVRSRDQLFSMIFPRMLALAERAWHKASWEEIDNKEDRDAEKARDWEKFANVLGYRELSRLDRIGVTYRVPPPGASYDNKKLKAMAVFPGLKIEYSTDSKNWKEVDEGTNVEGKIKLRTRSADGSRYSRLVEIELPSSVRGNSPRLTSKYVHLVIVAVIGFLLL
ncbi:PREDICTED: chitobiase-like [Acropora digitifera]|uniref:chitobiase-like n=1 Tax=Acropora digitifera TaxID=70779 RepID=UPI00077AEBAA|nr:PREDICTED: chitobiase-like [Acropora digitifera]